MQKNMIKESAHHWEFEIVIMMLSVRAGCYRKFIFPIP